MLVQVTVQMMASLKGFVADQCVTFTGRLSISVFVVSERSKESLPLLGAVEMVVFGNASLLDFLDGAIAASRRACW
jgi:phosphatidylglycerophosphate synthase